MAAPTVAQSNANDSGGGNTCKYNNAQTAGNANLVLTAWDTATGSTTAAPSDTSRNTYTKVTSVQANSTTIVVWLCQSIVAASAGANTVTAGVSGQSFQEMYIFEIAGSSGLDAAITTGATGSSSTATTSAKTTSVANELLLAYCYNNTNATGTPGTGWTKDANSVTSFGALAETRTVATSGSSITGTVPLASSNTWGIIMVGFEPPTATVPTEGYTSFPDWAPSSYGKKRNPPEVVSPIRPEALLPSDFYTSYPDRPSPSQRSAQNAAAFGWYFEPPAPETKLPSDFYTSYPDRPLTRPVTHPAAYGYHVVPPMPERTSPLAWVDRPPRAIPRPSVAPQMPVAASPIAPELTVPADWSASYPDKGARPPVRPEVMVEASAIAPEGKLPSDWQPSYPDHVPKLFRPEVMVESSAIAPEETSPSDWSTSYPDRPRPPRPQDGTLVAMDPEPFPSLAAPVEGYTSYPDKTIPPPKRLPGEAFLAPLPIATPPVPETSYPDQAPRAPVRAAGEAAVPLDVAPPSEAWSSYPDRSPPLPQRQPESVFTPLDVAPPAQAWASYPDAAPQPRRTQVESVAMVDTLATTVPTWSTSYPDQSPRRPPPIPRGREAFDAFPLPAVVPTYVQGWYLDRPRVPDRTALRLDAVFLDSLPITNPVLVFAPLPIALAVVSLAPSVPQ